MKLIFITFLVISTCVYIHEAKKKKTNLLKKTKKDSHVPVYTCDTTQLASSNVCVFTANPDTTETMAPSNIDNTVGAANYRQICNSTGQVLKLGLKPWTNGIHLCKSTSKVEGDEWRYVLSLELMAPIRDTVMYKPDTLKDPKEWDKVSQLFKDCKIKTESKDLTGPVPKRNYGTDDVYDIIVNPQKYASSRLSPHQFILKWIEEGTASLWCLMTTKNLTDDFCPEIAEKNSITTGDVSSCWQKSYEARYGSMTSAGEY